MTDSDRTIVQVARLSRIDDADLIGVENSAAASALLAAIVAERVPPVGSARSATAVRRWGARLAIATAVTAAATATVVVGPGLFDDGAGPAASYANAAIAVTREDDFLVARIKDPLADRERFREAFRALGKDVEIELVPVPPAHVGQLLSVASENGSGSQQHPTSVELVPNGTSPADCWAEPTRCTIVIRIPVDTTAATLYRLGRAAQPGESYQAWGSGSGGPAGTAGRTPGSAGQPPGTAGQTPGRAGQTPGTAPPAPKGSVGATGYGTGTRAGG